MYKTLKHNIINNYIKNNSNNHNNANDINQIHNNNK